LKPKFDFYEKVRVSTSDDDKSSINGLLGAILGRAQRESGDWYYAVHIYEKKESWDLYEHELTSTGEFDSRDSFYTDDRVRVTVDPDGKGKLICE
jgi:hypothetical protein